MHKSAQKAAKRTNKVAQTKAQPKRQVKKVVKKAPMTRSKRTNFTASTPGSQTSLDTNISNLRRTPPDYFKNKARHVEEDDTYAHIMAGPTQAYTRSELPDTPHPILLAFSPWETIHPAVRAQLRYGSVDSQFSPVPAVMPKGLRAEMKLCEDFQDPSFQEKLKSLRTKISSRPYAQRDDDQWISDPFGFNAMSILRKAQQDQYDVTLNPDDRIGFAEAAGTGFATAMLGIYFFDAVTGFKFNLPGIVNIVPQAYEDLMTSPQSNLFSRSVNALPFAAAGVVFNYGTSRRLREQIPIVNFMPDMAKGGQELRLAVAHLQRVQAAVVDGSHYESVISAFDRHGESIANVLPNGHLISTKFNQDFVMPPQVKVQKHEHH